MTTRDPSAPNAVRRQPPGLKSALAALALLALSGCAQVYLIDNQVQSFARWADPAVRSQAPAAVPQAPQSFRFERLPSQREGRAAAGQDGLESLARVALTQVGWSLAEAGTPTPWTVQVAASTLRLPRAPWEDPWDSHYWGGFGMLERDHVVTGSGQIIWAPVFIRMNPPYYLREVSLVIRHAASTRVVFETRATHDGRWNNTPALWSAMLDAALQDFPAPPGGERQVNIEVPR